MSKKFSFSGAPKDATPHYDAGDPSVKAKGFHMTETSEKVELHEPNRKYSFSKVSNVAASEPYHDNHYYLHSNDDNYLCISTREFGSMYLQTWMINKFLISSFHSRIIPAPTWQAYCRSSNLQSQGKKMLLTFFANIYINSPWSI